MTPKKHPAPSTEQKNATGGSEQTRRSRSAPKHPEGARPTGRNRVLLADDDPTVRESLQNLLVGEGYRVMTAADGEEAVKMARRASVDLVLLDLNMPVKNGWDAFGELTFEHPLLPIIIITARPNQVFTAVSAGAGALLEKPMDIPTLLKAMEKLLAEPAEQRLSRLVGNRADFYFARSSPTQAKEKQ